LAARDARRLDLQAAHRHAGDRSGAVDRLAEAVDDAAQQPVAHGHGENAAGGLDGLAFLDVRALAEDDRADGLFVEVERDTERPVLELEQLVDTGVRQAGDARDAVADLEDAAHLRDLDGGLEPLEVLAQRVRDVLRVERQFSHGWLSRCSLRSLA
jgi:hypothetical protein